MTNPDADIMMALRCDDPRALDLIHARYGGLIARQVLMVMGNAAAAQDVEQDVYVTIAKRRKQIAGARLLLPYLLTLARNEALGQVRRRRPDRAGAQPPDLAAPCVNQTAAEDAERISGALMELPLDQREVILLHVWEGLTFPDISKALGAKLNTVMSRYRYACEKLRSRLRSRHG